MVEAGACRTASPDQEREASATAASRVVSRGTVFYLDGRRRRRHDENASARMDRAPTGWVVWRWSDTALRRSLIECRRPAGI